MTQPNTAVGSEANPSADARTDALNTFEDMAGEFFPEEEEDEPTAEGEEAPEEGEPEAEETEDEAEADDLPPIEPPVSLSAEEKEAFKNLPREAQEFTARRIGELEKGFQTKAQEAARARQEAEQAAIEQLTAYQRNMAQQYEQLASQVLPKRPDPQMLQYDPQGFYAQQAAYEGAVAQQRELQQQSQEYARQAQAYEAHLEQQQLAQEHRAIVEQFPEYADPTTGPKLQAELSAVAREMGYPPELIGQARAQDILAMRKAAEWKAKAEQLDKLNSQKMQKVRAAKGLPKVATPGVSQGAKAVSQARADQAWARAKAGKSIQDKAAGFADWADSVGLV